MYFIDKNYLHSYKRSVMTFIYTLEVLVEFYDLIFVLNWFSFNCLATNTKIKYWFLEKERLGHMEIKLRYFVELLSIKKIHIFHPTEFHGLVPTNFNYCLMSMVN